MFSSFFNLMRGREMKRILLEVSHMRSEEQVSEYLKSVFNIESDEHLDLDAVYSCIMSINEDIEIKIDDADAFVKMMGRYALGLMKLLRDASNESDHISFDWQ
jgi:RNAse (barnase) inhibitor barstar